MAWIRRRLVRVAAVTNYLSDQDSEAVARDLERFCTAETVVEAEQPAETFTQAWDAKYPTISTMWRANWADTSSACPLPAGHLPSW